jgi:hypothetical protein
VSGQARVLRAMGWVALVAAIAGAFLLWISAREVLETTRRIVGHGTVEFQDLDVRISVTKIALGVGVLVLGAYLWALARVIADLSDRRREGDG